MDTVYGMFNGMSDLFRMWLVAQPPSLVFAYLVGLTSFVMLLIINNRQNKLVMTINKQVLETMLRVHKDTTEETRFMNEQWLDALAKMLDDHK